MLFSRRPKLGGVLLQNSATERGYVGMGSIPNTIRRGGVFHFRRALPAALQPLFNRTELTCSLRTADPAVARRLSRCLYLCSEELFDAARAAPMLSEQDIAALVKDFYSSILAQDETARLMRDDPIPEERRAYYIEHYRQLAERSRIDLANSAFGSVRSITSTMLARRFGQDVQLEKMDARRVSHAMLRAGIEVAEALKARAEGDFSYEPKDKLLAAALQGPAQFAPASQQSEPLAPAPPAPVGPPFSEEAEMFREAQLRRKVWEQQTGLQARKTYGALFADYFGDRPLANFTRRDAARFKELLEDLPANYGKAAEYRGVKAEQVVSGPDPWTCIACPLGPSSGTSPHSPRYGRQSSNMGEPIPTSSPTGSSPPANGHATSAKCGKKTNSRRCLHRQSGLAASPPIADRSPAQSSCAMKSSGFP